MKLICFPNYTAGGLLCDLLNNTTSELEGMTVRNNMPHHIFKSGDNGRVYRTFDEAFWLEQIEGIKSGKGTARYKYQVFNENLWFGTHCHPSCIPDHIFDQFEKVIAITTETVQSKFFRYLRNCYAFPDDDPKNLAKNVRESFETHPNSLNIEFTEIVNGNVVNEFGLNKNHFENWKIANSFLYSKVDQTLVECFYEGE